MVPFHVGSIQIGRYLLKNSTQYNLVMTFSYNVFYLRDGRPRSRVLHSQVLQDRAGHRFQRSALVLSWDPSCGEWMAFACTDCSLQGTQVRKDML